MLLATYHRRHHSQVEVDGVRVHWDQKLFTPGAFRAPLGMMQHAVDPLHLNLLNKFKQLLTGTIFSFLSEEMLNVVQEYCHLMGFMVKFNRKEGEDPVSSWAGPDCRRLMENAATILPHLLHLAHAPASAGPAARAALEGAKAAIAEPTAADVEDDEDDADYDYIPTPAEVQAEKDATPMLIVCAKAWDRYFELVDYESRVFEEDSDKYREQRMVSYFNAEVATKRDLILLGVGDKSFGSHIGMCVVPRQILTDGDPGRRGCNVNEAFGAKCKDVIHNQVCRRKVCTGKKEHKRMKDDGSIQTWEQTFKFGRIAQVLLYLLDTRY